MNDVICVALILLDTQLLVKFRQQLCRFASVNHDSVALDIFLLPTVFACPSGTELFWIWFP